MKLYIAYDVEEQTEGITAGEDSKRCFIGAKLTNLRAYIDKESLRNDNSSIASYFTVDAEQDGQHCDSIERVLGYAEKGRKRFSDVAGIVDSVRD